MSAAHDWRAEANCRGMETAVFFPERGAPTEEAKAICADCPVILQCAEAGRYERFGIWAGKSVAWEASPPAIEFPDGARWMVIVDGGAVTCGAGELERIVEGGGIVVDLGAERA